MVETELLIRSDPGGRHTPNSIVGDAFASRAYISTSRPKRARRSAGAKDARIAKIEMFVERNLHRNIRLGDVARLASLEKHYFAVLFRKSSGKTFMRWLREQRVQRAVHMLKRRSCSIASIAWAVGYSDSTGLARAFREVLGMSPRAARSLLHPRTACGKLLENPYARCGGSHDADRLP